MSSSPAWGTIEKPCIYKVSQFFYDKNIVILAEHCQPYREPVIRYSRDGCISHIEFYYTPFGFLNLRRVRFFAIPGKDEKEKLHAARICLAEISQKLRLGTIDDSSEHLTFEICLKEFYNAKKHLRTSGRRIEMSLKPFIDFVQKNELFEKKLKQFDSNFIEKFKNDLLGRGLANRTVNNYCSASRTLWRFFMDNKWIEENIFSKIKKLNSGTGRNVAYLPDQIEILKPFHQKFPDLDFLAKFMYYTLLRTNEIANLKVKHLLTAKADQLYLPAEISKNGFERHIILPPPLLKIIKSMRLHEKNKEYFLFGRQTLANSRYKPLGISPEAMLSKNIGHKYREQILDKAEFSKDYTLYSWKHTGVVNAHNMGVPDADIMQQTGHRNYESFTKYMKSLGLFKRGQYAALIPEI